MEGGLSEPGEPRGPRGGGKVLQVDLDHLLLDGGWKRGEFDWLK